MTSIDPAIVEALAHAATPGPWHANVLGSEGYAVVSEQSRTGKHHLSRIRVARFGYEDWGTDKANAEYVAAVDPQTILELLADLAAARAEVARLRAAVEAVEAVLAAPDDTQWWPVEPYMDPPDDDEVVEVHVVNVDRVRAALPATEDQP